MVRPLRFALRSTCLRGKHISCYTTDAWWSVRVLPPPVSLIWGSPEFIRLRRTADATDRPDGCICSSYNILMRDAPIYFGLIGSKTLAGNWRIELRYSALEAKLVFRPFPIVKQLYARYHSYRLPSVRSLRSSYRASIERLAPLLSPYRPPKLSRRRRSSNRSAKVLP